MPHVEQELELQEAQLLLPPELPALLSEARVPPLGLKNDESFRRVSGPPHSGQVMGASASFIARRA
jgi:hypothetical protein